MRLRQEPQSHPITFAPNLVHLCIECESEQPAAVVVWEVNYPSIVWQMAFSVRRACFAAITVPVISGTNIDIL